MRGWLACCSTDDNRISHLSLSFLSCSLLSLLLSPFSPALSSLLSPIHKQAQVSPIHKLRSLDVTQWAVHNRICCTALRGSIGALVKSCCGTLLFLPMLVKMLPTDIDRHDQTISSSALSLLDEESRHRQEAERDEPGMELHINHDWSLTLPRLLEFGGGIHFHKI